MTLIFMIFGIFKLTTMISMREKKEERERRKERETEGKGDGDGEGEGESIIFKSCCWTRSILHNRKK